MAIHGDLEDMSLLNVIQFLFQDGRKNVLFLSRKSEDGVIYFDHGEPVHAITGSLAGEEAVYKLLAWTEGTFRVSAYDKIPRRTITTSWNDLVLEAMRRAHELARTAASKVENDQTLTQAEVEQDSSLENSVINLLSGLEQSRAHLLEKGIQTQPTQALRILVEMANQIAAFSEDHLYLDVLAEALACETDGRLGACELSVVDNRLSVQAPARQSDWGADPATRREAFRQVGDLLIRLLGRSTSLITRSFRSPHMIDKWSVTCTGFIADLTDAVEGIRA